MPMRKAKLITSHQDLSGGLEAFQTDNKKPASTGGWSGNVLFSHGATPAVSSELEGLTSVFGMGTGVSLPQ